jgi:HlyD family secretion protein
MDHLNLQQERFMNKRIGFAGLLILIGSALLAACSGGGTPESTTEAVPVVIDDLGVSAEGRLVPGSYVQLGFATGAEIIELLVKEGDPVEAGQLLAQLEQLQNREALEAAAAGAAFELLAATQALADLYDAAPILAAQAQLDLAAARDLLDDTEYRWRVQQPGNRASGDVINAAEANLVLADQQVEQAQKEYNKYSGRDEDDPVRALALSNLSAARQQRDAVLRQLNWYTGQPTDLDQAMLDAEVALAQAQAEEAERQWGILQAGPDPDLVALAEERITNAQTQLAAAEAALEDYDNFSPELIAPIAGTAVHVDLKVGENAIPGQVAVVVADLSTWQVETADLTEIEVVKVEEGQAVTIVPDALPEIVLTGTVESISNLFEERRGDITYTTRIQVREGDPRLRWGMTVVVTFVEP